MTHKVICIYIHSSINTESPRIIVLITKLSETKTEWHRNKMPLLNYNNRTKVDTSRCEIPCLRVVYSKGTRFHFMYLQQSEALSIE